MKSKQRSLVWFSLVAAGLAATVIKRQARSDRRTRLQGKVVLITGGSRGLGFALALELGALGCRLVLIARDGDELERAKAALVESTGVDPAQVLLQVADVSRPEQIRVCVEEATAYFGQIDVLINNAGIILVGPLESQRLESFQEAMNVNFFGALHTTLAVLPQMLGRAEGAIVNIGSIGGKVAFPHLLPYVASKFALVGWSQGLHAELAGRGLHVTTVAPGVMRTGSHIQARYTGKARAEYGWFASAASFPGTATDARTAARTIIRGLVSHRAEVAIGLQAILASRLSNVAPEWTAAALSLVNELLPQPNSGGEVNFFAEDVSRLGHHFLGSLPKPLEWLGDGGISRYNQLPPEGRDLAMGRVAT